MSQSPFRIGIAGLGTVGVGVVKILQQRSDLIAKRVGRPIEIVSVIAGNKNKDRGVDISAYDWAETLEDLANDDRIDAVIELVGGAAGDIKTMVERALDNGKHVVTANKALLAHHGYDLARRAEAKNVTIAYEAAIAGGIPIVKNLREGLAANDVSKVYGILNGTCNYILTEMRETGGDFNDILKEAQEKGYAEADPTFDVDGIDAAHKLVLLGALAFGVKPDFEGLEIEGIRKITAKDIMFAQELGYKIKLIGMAQSTGENKMQSMAPCLVDENSPLGNVEGVFNAVMTHGDFVDDTIMVGRGAGEGPTASSVVADIIDIARGDIRPVFGVPVSELEECQWKGPESLTCKTYIHLKVEDKPGVIADITTCLKEAEVSIDSFIQHGHEDDGTASLVIMTQKAPFSVTHKAVGAVEQLACVLDNPTLLRVENT